tara:strand:- start:244 stop:2130 length:1887 start_codon:yes stop_codon:yes gene_type:complete
MEIFISNMMVWRKELHMIPELCFQEYKTAKYIEEKLDSFNIPTIRIGNTAIVGIIGEISNNNIAIRADLDGLPIIEKKHLYSSKHNGCMHACGHDGHIAIVLGVAQYLSTLKLNKTIYFVFTPAEEEGGGCNYMLNDPKFQNLNIKEIYGIHNWPSLDIGTIGISDNVIMAGDDNFEITITGKSGHSAMPELAINPIRYISILLTKLKLIEQTHKAIITPTHIESCKSYNVIPESIIVVGTIRYINNHQQILDDLQQIIIPDITLSVNIIPGYPATVNHKQCVDYVKDIINKNKIATITNVEPSMATEDFSYMLQKIPGCYLWIGSRDENHQYSLHNCNYDFNDAILKIGFEYFVQIILGKDLIIQPKSLQFDTNLIYLGFIQLATDYNLDMEIGDLLSQIPGIGWRLQKIPPNVDTRINSEMFKKLKTSIRTIASNFVPHKDDYGAIKVMSLACTSMSFILTPEVVHQELKLGYDCITNDMATSLLKATKVAMAHGYCRIGLFTPYEEDVHQMNIDFLMNNDCNIVVNQCLGLKYDMDVSSISRSSIIECIRNMLFQQDIDLIIIGCSAFKVMKKNFIDELEKEFGKLFITSNQAMLWNALYLALDNNRYDEIKQIKGYGKLFQLTP